MYDLYLLRHGNSKADDEKKCEGRYDSPLTELGKKQALNTAEYFKKHNIKFETILSSPLVRAKETAEIINKSQCTNLIIEDLLMEQDNGVLAGMFIDDVKNKFQYPDWYSPFRYFPNESGENSVELHARAGFVLANIMKLNSGKLLVVAHGGILNALIRNMLCISYPVDKSGHSFMFGDNGLLHIKYDETCHKWTICSFINSL